ncbi:response regulator transcription factor [Pontiellaceae bacterium B1224]|nr:response regulator transcription factor [Pontiellaceae bacterium B1224]
MTIRLLLADDHQLMRDGLKALVDKEEDMLCVGEAEDGFSTIDMAEKINPHVIIMDVAMPDLNGIEATRRILELNPNIRVVALSGHQNNEFVRQMLEVGASAYILKTRAYEEFSRAVREVMAGRKYLSPEIARGVVDEYVELAAASDTDSAFILLTDREREVLQLLSEGSSTKEMADRLGISVKTVETHRRNIMDKLDLHSVAELTKYAISEGITTLDE